jgi:hypothetical protein
MIGLSEADNRRITLLEEMVNGLTGRNQLSGNPPVAKQQYSIFVSQANAFARGQAVAMGAGGVWALLTTATPPTGCQLWGIVTKASATAFSVTTNGRAVIPAGGLSIGALYAFNFGAPIASVAAGPFQASAMDSHSVYVVNGVGVSATVGSTSALTSTINQNSHGFSVGDIVGSTPSGMYRRVLADNTDDFNAMAIVSSVLDANDFIATFEGIAVGVLSGLTAGSRYWLDHISAGTATATQPYANAVQVFTALNATDVDFHVFHSQGYANKTGIEVLQVAHGFIRGDILRIDNLGVYQLATADSLTNSDVVGIVAYEIDADQFVLISEGIMPRAIGGPLPTPGDVYFLDPTGGFTTTKPDAFPVQLFTIVDGGNSYYVNIQRLASSPDAVGYIVHQPGHSFTLGQVLRVSGADTYALAKADTAANAKAIGVVGKVIGVDDFFLVTSGRIIDATLAQPSGTILYLSATVAGELTSTPPPANVVRIAETPDDDDIIVNIIPTPIPSSIQIQIHQIAHPFTAVGQVVKCVSDDTYDLAQADTATNAKVVGVISEIIDADNFVMTMAGVVGGLSGLTAAQVSYLSATTAGGVVTTAPGSNVVAVWEAIDTTTAIVNIEPQAAASSSGYTSQVSFTYTGSAQTFTVPAGVTKLRCVLVGAGAGGGTTAAASLNSYYVSSTTPGFTASQISFDGFPGGGGGGMRFVFEITVVPGNTITINIGLHGTGGVNPSGAPGAGGASTLACPTGTMTAGGGFAGESVASGNPRDAGQAGKGGTTCIGTAISCMPIMATSESGTPGGIQVHTAGSAVRGKSGIGGGGYHDSYSGNTYGRGGDATVPGSAGNGQDGQDGFCMIEY